MVQGSVVAASASPSSFSGIYAVVYGFLTVMAVLFLWIICRIKKEWKKEIAQKEVQ